MREIKFRGKNKDIGWVYGQLVFDENENAYIVQNVEQDSSYGTEETMLYATMWYRVDKETIGQYTGLHDKNGKEIYEGDIVKAYEGKIQGELIFDLRGLHFGVKVSNIENYTFSQNFLNSKDIEVIGNIYENKDLLED